MNRVLADTSFLYALADPNDKFRSAALQFAQESNAIRVVPDVVLTEATYLINTSINYEAMIRFLKALSHSDVEIIAVTRPDIERTIEIMETYTDAHFDFVDCCIMALTERLNITRVCTFDRRDFSIFRPNHCDYLELLP